MVSHFSVMRKRRLMLLGMAFLSVIMFSPSAAAQSSTVVSADSNLSDTNLTVDFSGLEADTEYSLEALTADGTQSITSFTSSSSGAASVEFRHAPFTRDQSTLSAGSSRGWIYQLSYTENDSQAYTFELVHGNMLTGIDTFNDASVNQDIWNFNNNGDGDCNFAENENTGVYYF